MTNNAKIDVAVVLPYPNAEHVTLVKDTLAGYIWYVDLARRGFSNTMIKLTRRLDKCAFSTSSYVADTDPIEEEHGAV